MGDALEIRMSAAQDLDALEALYPAAFPDEDLLPLVHDLLAAETGVFSLVAVRNSAVAGHVAFTVCRAGQERVCLLGPLGVHPDFQGQGIGTALVEAGLSVMKADGSACALVLGDPAYYGRFGFVPERKIKPPYTLPDEWRDAWQSLRLGERADDYEGTLIVPDVWAKPAYWAA